VTVDKLGSPSNLSHTTENAHGQGYGGDLEVRACAIISRVEQLPASVQSTSLRSSLASGVRHMNQWPIEALNL
jgi:hypothetical protein